jgi:cystathionine gamma-synthase
MAEMRPETIAAQALGLTDPRTGAVVPPIDVATTYLRDEDNQYRSGFTYGRPDNATVRHTEAVIAALEGGHACLLTSSGMTAATTAFLALPRPAHVIAPRVMYWALKLWLADDAPSHGITTTFIDGANLDDMRVAIRPGETKLIWIETPANPLWTVTDIRAAADLAHGAGALLAVDSTVATPVLTRPVALGADIVMHAATKALNGHSDVIAGALVYARSGPAFDAAARVRKMLGGRLSGFDAYLVQRGLRTLHLRVRAQCNAAMRIAAHFADHPRIGSVLYPGLPSDPGYAIAARQMQGGFGSMLSIRVKDGEAAAIRAAARVKIWKRATSLGGVESLIEHRASIEGPGTPCPPDLLRLSVGIEHVDDLIDDLEQAIGQG